MKIIKKIFLFLSCIFLFGCTTKPVGKMLEKFPHSKELSTENGILKFIFPEFEDAENNVIHGDGSIIIFPNNKIMVIDGYDSDIGERYTEYLKDLGYSKIDYLLATHYHVDHIGGFKSLIENFEIGCFYSQGAPINTSYSSKLLELLDEKEIPQVVLGEGNEMDLDGVHFKVYSPYLDENELFNIMNNPGKTEKLINNSSLVFKVSYGDFSIMYTGDVYKNRERELCRKYGDELKATLLKVSHHADFYTANSYKWLATVQPEYGIVIDNIYINRVWGGYVIRNRFSLTNVLPLYNNNAGEIIVETDGKEYSISNQ